MPVDRNSRGTESAEACMRAGCMYWAPHIKILNAQSTDGTFRSKYAVEVAALRSFDSEDTRIEIQRSMSAHEREKHVERLDRQLPNWNISQEMGTGPLNITQMIIQEGTECASQRRAIYRCDFPRIAAGKTIFLHLGPPQRSPHRR